MGSGPVRRNQARRGRPQYWPAARPAVGASDEIEQVKVGTRTAVVKRQYPGSAGKVAIGDGSAPRIWPYLREGTGTDLVVFRTEGGLVTGLLTDGVRLDFVWGDEVYGTCTQLRDYPEVDQAYVMRIPSRVRPSLVGRSCSPAYTPPGLADADGRCARRDRIQGANPGAPSNGWNRFRLAPPTGPPPPDHRRPRLLLLLADRRTASQTVPPVRTDGLHWPADEDFDFSKDCLGLDQSRGSPVHRDRPGTPCWSRPLRLDSRCRHQARSRSYHQQTRLSRDAEIILVSI